MTLLPGWLVALMVLGLPVAVALFFGRAALRPVKKELYRCLRCDHTFRDDAWRGYPGCCPACRSTEWNTRAGDS